MNTSTRKNKVLVLTETEKTPKTIYFLLAVFLFMRETENFKSSHHKFGNAPAMQLSKQQHTFPCPILDVLIISQRSNRFLNSPIMLVQTSKILFPDRVGHENI